MPSLDPHTLKVLEFDRIVEMLGARVPSSLGRRALARLTPSPDRQEVLLRQRRTAEMRSLLESERFPSWGGVRDVSEQLERLGAEGSWIEPPAYLRVADFAAAAEGIRRGVAAAREDAPALQEIATRIPPLGPLAAEIRRCITTDGEVADSASPELARLRRALEKGRREIIGTLERLLESAERAGAVQEKIVTLRGERYVIPVKAGARGAVPGLVHDRSASGQTLFVEPEAVVERNNALRELAAAQKEEVQRILRHLGERVREAGSDLEEAMELTGLLETVWSMARLATELDMCEPEIFRDEGRVDLRGARHPLLQAAVGGGAVPVDFGLGGETRTLVITGPNTGGKTVALKTVGLLALMAQSGLQIPARRGSGLSCFPEVLADIGDEQSIEQNLSTFSGHIRNLIAVLERSRPGALILLDELGAGTDPSEGAALGIAVLEETLAVGALTVVTTHHNAVKVFAASTPGAANASMEFDTETLRPTYRLLQGAPGRSQAFHVAARLGLRREIIERARGHQDAGEVKLDGLMADLERERRELARERTALAEARRRASLEEEKGRRRWEEKRATLEREGRRALREAVREVDERLREMKSLGRREGVEPVRAAMGRVEEVLRRHAPAERKREGVGHVRPGDRVLVGTLRSWGTVEEARQESAIVIVDGKRFTVPLGDIEKKEEGTGRRRGEGRTPGGRYSVEVPEIPSSQIDLRGLRAEEAIARLDRYLEHALLGGLTEITIIHGKGTGRLQESVAGHLSAHPRVEAYGAAPLEQGGAGVTKARLAV